MSCYKCIIYIIKCETTGLLYIGRTSMTLEERIKLHISSINRLKNYPLYRDMALYGVSDFSWSSIDKTDLIDSGDKEKHWQFSLNTIYPNGYNTQRIGLLPLRRIKRRKLKVLPKIL